MRWSVEGRASHRVDLWIALVLGIGLAVGGAVAALLYAGDDARRAQVLLAVVGAELATGREPALSIGLAAGMDWVTAATITTTIELVLLLVGYPFIVLAGDWVRERRAVKRLFARAEARARRKPNAGVVMLGALTLAPFVPVGALTSVLVGELLRLPSRYLLPVLATALVLANIATAYATSRLISLFPHPELVAAGMTALLLVGAGVAWLVHRARSRPQA